MKTSVGLIAALLALAVETPIVALAQTYPSRPIRIIVPYPAGGVLDTITRAIGEQARHSLGQPWIIENRMGGSGAVGLQACAQSAPDGYTFCAVTGEALSVTPHFDPKLYERYRSLVPVSQFVTAPGVVYANPQLQAGNLREVVALAKAKPTELNYSSWGPGTSPHLFFEWLKKTNSIEILHIPLKGSNDAMNEVLSGRVQLSYVTVGFAKPQIDAGKLKPLAVLGDERSDLLPNSPALAELGISFPYKGAWFGLLAPPGTPTDILEKVAMAVNGAVNNPELRAKFLDGQGYKPVGSSPTEFAAMVKSEYAHGAEILRVTGIKAE